jgi:hypothetical protein
MGTYSIVSIHSTYKDSFPQDGKFITKKGYDHVIGFPRERDEGLGKISEVNSDSG